MKITFPFGMLTIIVCCILAPGTARDNPPVIFPDYVPALLPDNERDDCQGHVVEITKASISIKPTPGHSSSTSGLGKRRYNLSSTLASGAYIQTAADSLRYKITDVKIGDRVDIVYHRKVGIETCDAISILRRPGGKIPKGHYEDGGNYVHHELCQAHQDFEEKGIPIPARFIPNIYLNLPPQKSE